MHLEPIVRIRCASPEDAARCRALLDAAGLAPEEQLTWLAVREADPDAVNELLVTGGALGRSVAREQVGRLLGWLLEREGRLEGRGAALEAQVRRALQETGLQGRYAPRPPEELLAAGARLHEHLLATGAGFVPWSRYVEELCVRKG